MADEITINLNVRATNGLFKFQPAPINVRIDQTTAGGGGPGLYTVATTETTIDFGQANPGLIIMQNTDTTNFVTWGFNTGQLDAVLSEQNEPTLINLETNSAVIMKADTAACKVYIEACNIV